MPLCLPRGANRTHWHAGPARRTKPKPSPNKNGASVSVVVKADAGSPENVVHLPLHTENAALGALMDTIELAGSLIMQEWFQTSLPQHSVWAILGITV